AAAAALLALAPAARAVPTRPGERTIWDEIMADQAQRGLIQGQQELMSKDYAQALREIRRAVDANPDDPTGHLLLGVAQYWNGMVDDSIASYKAALALKPDDSEGHMLLGISYAWKDDTSAAEAEFREAVRLSPERADARMNLGSILESRGDLPGALDSLRRAVELDQTSALYHFQLGTLYRKLGRDGDAVAEFEAAVRLQPDYEDALLELGCALDRRAAASPPEARAALYKEAASSLRKAVGLKPGDAVARMRLARLDLESGDASGARSVMSGAFHLTPESGAGGLQLSLSYAGGRSRGAAAPGGGSSGAKGAEKPAAPPPQDPLSLFERNLRRVPLDRSAVMHVDAVFLPRPKLVRAGSGEDSSLRRALAKAAGAGSAPGEEAPRAVRRDFPLEAADARGREKQIEAVMAELRGIMASAPADSDARLGMSLTYQRPADVGREGSSEPPKVSYEPRRVGNDMGLWVMGTGWMALAAEVLPDPGDAPPGVDGPDAADWWTMYGLAYAAVGEGQSAATAFVDATRRDPKSAPAWMGRAVAAVMNGDEPSAIAALKRALALDPKDRAAADGLKWLERPSVAAPEGAK
ncbi:MAG: tetratricopeptide repeat protein, partial [Elusimicrobia bacterium]|nr:tetratricopeptide repeat protein [Elusimicrobiota bacterium]